MKDAAVDLHGYKVVFRRDIRNSERMGITKLLTKTDGAASAEITDSSEKVHPLILVDHNPGGIFEAWAHGADLVLSGHTHGGQAFPGDVFFRLEPGRYTYGYRRKAGRHAIITSGVGAYGCPIRLGINTEIVLVEINS